MLSTEETITLPGVTSSNGIKLYAGYQIKRQNEFLLDEDIRVARGYKTYLNKELLTCGIDYIFPIVYPDYTFLKSLYIRRVKAAIFFDQSWLTGKGDITQQHDTNYQFKSGGLELITDLNFFQISAPLK